MPAPRVKGLAPQPSVGILLMSVFQGPLYGGMMLL